MPTSAFVSTVLAIFTLAAEREERADRTYDEWVAAVTARFSRTWAAFDAATPPEADRD